MVTPVDTPDRATRLLDLAIRRLPARRRDWGEAMSAELAALTDSGDRRRFVTDCVLAVLRQPTTILALGRGLCALAPGALALTVAAGIDDILFRLAALAMIVGCTAVAAVLARTWSAGPGRAARLSRWAGVLLVTAAVLDEVYRWQHWPRVDPTMTPKWGTLLAAGVMLLANIAAVLVLTARQRELDRWPLVLVWGTATVAALGSIPLALDQSGFPLPLLAVGAATSTALVTAHLSGNVRTALAAGLCSGAIALLAIATLDTAVYQLVPASVPHIVDPVMLPGTPAAVITANNELEAEDPFVILYALGVGCAIGAVIAGLTGRHTASARGR